MSETVIGRLSATEDGRYPDCVVVTGDDGERIYRPVAELVDAEARVAELSAWVQSLVADDLDEVWEMDGGRIKAIVLDGTRYVREA